MKGGKFTYGDVFLSKNGTNIVSSNDPLPIAMIDKNLILKGKMIRRKKPYKINYSSHRVSHVNPASNSSPIKQRETSYSGNNFIKNQSLKLQSKLLSSYDILSYLQMKCSNVFFRTQSNFSNVYSKQSMDNYGNIGIGIKRMPTTQSRIGVKNENTSNFKSVQNNFTQTKIQSYKKFASEVLETPHSCSPAKPKTGRKSFINSPVNIGKYKKADTKIKTQEQPKQKLPNIDRALLSINYNDLKNVKSQSYAMIQLQTNQLVLLNRGKLSLEIASITKIMTAYVIITLSEIKNIDLKNQKYQVQQYVQRTTGTSAQLIHGDIYTIQQLLYGLLLPSGNDAALVLADWGGSIFNRQLGKESQYKQNVSIFVQQMTKTAKELGLKDTRYGNPHGLPHTEGKSTALDQCRLALACMKKSLFNEIVKTKQYKFQILNSDYQKRTIIWQNTNKLLRRQGFIGLKTGITVTAGPCLLSAYQFKNKTYILTVLRASKVSRRFKDSRKIIHWALSKLYEGKTYFQQSLQLQQLKKNKKQFDSDYSQDQNQFVYGQQGSDQYSRRKNILTNDL